MTNTDNDRELALFTKNFKRKTKIRNIVVLVGAAIGSVVVFGLCMLAMGSFGL